MFKTVVTTLGLALAACSVGEVKGAGGTDAATTADPRAATFADDVLPLVNAKGCNNAGTCHGGGTQNPQMLTFTDMTTNGPPGRYISTPAAANVIIIKDGGTGTHQLLPYLDTADKMAISTWLESAP